MGSYLIPGNELSEVIHVLTKQENLLGGDAWTESRSVTEPRRAALPHSWQSRVLWYDLSFQVVCQIILTQGPSKYCTHWSAKIDSSEENSGRLVVHVVFLFDLS